MDTTSTNSHISKSNLLVDKLPSELLGRIFILGTDEYRSFRKPFSQDVGFQDIVIVSSFILLSKPAFIYLGRKQRVCRRWREVGLQTPTVCNQHLTRLQQNRLIIHGTSYGQVSSSSNLSLTSVPNSILLALAQLDYSTSSLTYKAQNPGMLFR